MVADAIAQWAGTRFATPVSVLSAETLSGGLDNYVHSFELSGDSLPDAWRGALVVRIAPSAQRLPFARTEMQIQNWLADKGYPAARVLTLLSDDWSLQMPAQIAQRAPGGQLLDAVQQHPLRVGSLIRLLATLHVELHSIATDGWPASDNIGTAAARRFHLIRERVDKGEVEIGVALRRVERGIAECTAHPVESVVCHGDFHPLNVVFNFDSGSAVVVDWTDATVDDPHSDIARTATLFRCAAIAGSSPIERVALHIIGPALAQGYLRSYAKRRPVDRTRLRHWEALHLLNGWAQINSLGDPGVESSSAGQQFPPWIVRGIQRRLQRTLRRAES